MARVLQHYGIMQEEQGVEVGVDGQEILYGFGFGTARIVSKAYRGVGAGADGEQLSAGARVGLGVVGVNGVVAGVTVASAVHRASFPAN